MPLTGFDAEKMRQRAEEYRVCAEVCRCPDARAVYEALATSCDELAERLATHRLLRASSALSGR